MAVMSERHNENVYIFYQTKTLCDITLVCDDGVEIFAHKVILASASPVFLTMFNSSFKESKEQNVSIKEMDSYILEMIIKYAYTSKIDIKEHTIEKILKAANLYEIPYIIKLCYEYIKIGINHTNCISFMKTAELISQEEIYNYCFSYFLNYFYKLMESNSTLEKLFELQIDDIVKFISNDELVIESEEKIFDIIVGWINYDKNKRIHFLPDLMKHLRLPLIPKNELNTIYNEPLLKNNKNYYDKIMKDIMNVLTNPNTSQTTFMRAYSRQLNIVAISDSLVNYMNIGDMDNLNWKSYKSSFIFPPRPSEKCIVSENGFLLAIGNQEGVCTNHVDELDLKAVSKKWVSTTPMKKPRRKFAVCTHKQFVYVIGGIGHFSILDTGEYYDTNSKVWTEIIKPMTVPRHSFSAIIQNNKLFVCGSDKSRTSKEHWVEYFDLKKNKYWVNLFPLPTQIFSTTKGKNDIYFFGNQRVFKINSKNLTLDELPYMKSQYPESVAHTKNELFVLGRTDEELICERYNPEKTEWQTINMINKPSSYSYIICLNNVDLKSIGIHLSVVTRKKCLSDFFCSFYGALKNFYL